MTEILREELKLNSKRIRRGHTTDADESHAWFSDEDQHYVALCLQAGLVPFRGVKFTGSQPPLCKECQRFLSAIKKARAARVRELDAARRRARYHSDPKFRKMVQRINKRYAQKRKAVVPKATEAFDAQLAAYKEKWRAEEQQGG